VDDAMRARCADAGRELRDVKSGESRENDERSRIGHALIIWLEGHLQFFARTTPWSRAVGEGRGDRSTTIVTIADLEWEIQPPALGSSEE